MKRYLVIETWENSEPSLVTDRDGIVIEYNHIDDAMKEANNCQDGYVLDFNELVIIKPD